MVGGYSETTVSVRGAVSKSAEKLIFSITAQRTGSFKHFAGPAQELLQYLRIAGLLHDYDIYCIFNNDLEVTAMLKTTELAMPKSNTVTTVYNGKREVWTDYEEAKAYFLELMMSTEGEEHDRAECVYIQLMHGLEECSE